MKKFKICDNITIIEKLLKDDGEIIMEDVSSQIIIKINAKLSNEEKMETVLHEITHYLFFNFEECVGRNKNKKIEKLCDTLPLIIVGLWRFYPPFRIGIIDSSLLKI